MKQQQVVSNELTDYNVTMSNKLIRASHALTLIEKRCIGAVIAKIDSRKGHSLHAHLSEFKKIRLTALDYAESYGVDPKNAYEHLKKAADNLFERQISIINTTAKGKERLTKFRWVSSSTYAADEGFIELSFTEEVYPHLNALKTEYTQYKLKNAASFRSIYSWRLFEYAKSWLDYCVQNKKPALITIENLRNTLEVPEKYKWNDIKKRALDTAIKEIKKQNHLEITYTIVKKGRSIHALNIYVKLQDQLEFPM
jgi:plasmid replication initiation protein